MGSNSEVHPRDMCLWCGSLKLSRIIILVSVTLFLLPFFTLYYFSITDKNSLHMNHISSIDMQDTFNELADLDLKSRVEELLRIKGSVSSELRDMEYKRQKLQQELQGYSKNIEQLKSELIHQQTELNRLKISVEQAQVAQREALQQNTPDLALPNKLVPNELPPILPPLPRSLIKKCGMFSCFDHSRCSITSGFPVYLYDPDRYPVMNSGWDVDGFLKTTLKQTLGYNPHLTDNPKEACIFLVLVGESLKDSEDLSDNLGSRVNLTPLDGNALKQLPYWGGDGRNHVLINLARRDLSASSGDVFSTVDTGK